MKPTIAAVALLALPLLSASSAEAASTDPIRRAREVIARYVDASGGRAALDADTLLHRKGRIVQQGSTGRWQDWRQGSDRTLSVTQMGLIKSREGFDGARAWRTDLTSRNVGPVEGKDLDAVKAEAWFESEQWARDTTCKVRIGSASFLAGKSLQSVEVTPPVGPKKVLWFDQKTGLLSRVTHYRDQYDWNEEVGTWKTAAGRKRPTLFTAGFKEFPQSYVRADVDSFWVRAPRGADSFSPPGASSRGVLWTKARDRIELPFRYQRGHVWVRLSVNGAEPAEFILDTGAFNTCLDRSYAQTLGLSEEGEHVAEGVGGYDTFGFTKLRSLKWSAPSGASVELRDLRSGVIELQDALSSTEWGRTAGLIGYDVLKRFTLEIDFDREVIVLHEPSSYTHSGPGTAIPMTLHGNVPTVDVTLDGVCKGTYIVDVGNASVLSVGAEQVKACALFSRKRKDVQHWVGGIGGAFTETVCRMDSLQLGPFTMSGPIVGLTTHHQGGAGSKEVQGNLGTSVLERFHCTFDYAHGTLWLQPAARYAEHEAFTRSGLWYTRWAGVVIVFGVVRHSPAEDAGFKIRDVLRSINGRSVEKMTAEELDDVLLRGKPGSVVKVTYERELKEETVEVTLADVLD